MIYAPSFYQETQLPVIHRLVEEYNFGTVISRFIWSSGRRLNILADDSLPPGLISPRAGAFVLLPLRKRVP